MAEVRITIKDIEDGKIIAELEFDPPLDTFNDDDELPEAFVAGLALLAECSLSISDEPEDE